MRPTETQVTDEFARLLNSAVTTAINEQLGAVIEEAKANVETRVRGAVGSIAAKILSQFSYERMGTDLLIRVHFAFPAKEDHPTDGRSAI